MPLDATGTFRHNHESAQMHSKAAGKEYKAAPEAEAKDGGNMTEVHNHGDGTFHTVHGGQEEQHESIGHLHAHLSKLHGEDGHSHFHAHHDGVMHTSHSVKDGEAEHREHDDEEGVKAHLDEHLGTPDDQEPDGDEQPEKQGAGLSSLGY
jgi:hypothetical protein